MKIKVALSIAFVSASLVHAQTLVYSPTDTSSSSNAHYGLEITPTLNQTGTAGFTDLLINRTETGLGSGNLYFQDWQVAGTSMAHLDHSGNFIGATFTSTAATGAAPFTVSSTTNVVNLNASSLNGATFAAPGSIGSTTPSTAIFTTLVAGGGNSFGSYRENVNYDNSNGGISITSASASGTSQTMGFQQNSSNVGGITTTNTGTSFITTSDKRLKHDLHPFNSGAIIDALNPGMFLWNLDGSAGYGVYAQDAFKVFPNAVTMGGADPKINPWGVDYSKFVPVLLEEVKTLRARVARLEAERPSPKP